MNVSSLILPAECIKDFVLTSQLIAPSEDRLALINSFQGEGDESFRNILRDRIAARLSNEDQHMLPYIMEKLWYGNEMVWEPCVEAEIARILQ